uniref:Uncharacterized protein n=1 Tax=Aegilops tauschii subsp. strangulata TaxID=200361 RepID=A0A453M269_AEGTS
MAHISDIKLIRTDTTLDLSQKAEKGMSCKPRHPLPLIASPTPSPSLAARCGTKRDHQPPLLSRTSAAGPTI